MTVKDATTNIISMSRVASAIVHGWNKTANMWSASGNQMSMVGDVDDGRNREADRRPLGGAGHRQGKTTAMEQRARAVAMDAGRSSTSWREERGPNAGELEAAPMERAPAGHTGKTGEQQTWSRA